MYADQATGFTAEKSRLNSRQRDFSVSYRIQIAPDPHSSSNPMDTEGSLPGFSLNTRRYETYRRTSDFQITYSFNGFVINISGTDYSG
jgi:hypothetical protein